MIDKDKFDQALFEALKDLYGSATKAPPLDRGVVLTVATLQRAIEKYNFALYNE